MRSLSAPNTLTALSLALLSTLAQAETTVYQLRYFELGTGATAQQTTYGSDQFNNGVPTTGITYVRPDSTSFAGSYQASTFTAGAELTSAAADFIGTNYGAGSLAFRYGDSTVTTNNLTPAGYQAHSLSLSTGVVPNTALGLVSRDSGFTTFSLWNYSMLQPGESFQTTLGGTGGFAYLDRLQLRVGSNYLTGNPFINFEQQTRTGTTDAPVIARTLLGSTTPGSIFADLSQVDIIGLGFTRAAPSAGDLNPGVFATVSFFDAAFGIDGDLKELASFTFAAAGSFFLAPGDAGRFSSVSMSGNWLDTAPVVAVPEPGTYALMLAGLAVLVLGSRRRRQD